MDKRKETKQRERSSIKIQGLWKRINNRKCQGKNQPRPLALTLTGYPSTSIPLGTSGRVDCPSNTIGAITLLFLLAYSLCLALFLALNKTLPSSLARDFAPLPLAPRLDRVLPLVSFEALGVNLAPVFPPVTFNPFPFPPAALCEASLAITFDLDIRGFLPVKDRWIEFALLGKVVESLLAIPWFFTGAGMPDFWGNIRGLLNILLEFGEAISVE